MEAEKKAQFPKPAEIVSKKILENVKADLEKIHPRPHGFRIYPPRSEISFETQENKEKIIVLMRSHVITNIKWMIVLFFIVLFSLLIFIKTPILSIFPTNFKFFTILLWLFFITAIIVEKTLSWFFNAYIITDERIIDIDFYSLTAKRISEAKIENIEDVAYSQGGLLQSLFNYGTINIQTAGEKQEFDFENIPHPQKIASILNQLKLHEEQEKIEGRIS